MPAESTDLTHLRLERPSPGVARLVLDNPAQRNAMSEGMTRSWGRAIDLIAAVNGPAVGAGLCVALACDLRYAAAGATFSAPFVRLGMHPGMAATYLLPNVVGDAHARDLLLTGRSVDAEEARSLGLVTRVHQDAEFAEAVQEIADGIAATAPVPSRYTTAALRNGGHLDLESAIQWEALAQPITLATEDLQEGVRAAREKRPPSFRGL
jgi:enoyl-CoA hydratase